MDEYIRHANHNHAFYGMICRQSPDDYFDWKLITLFYIAFHYLKALARHRKKNIGEHHFQINNNIRSGAHHPNMPLSDTAYHNYMRLFHYSQDARYDEIQDLSTFKELRKRDHEHALKCFTDFRKYIISQGVNLDKPV
jgi:hypothetical protein